MRKCRIIVWDYNDAIHGSTPWHRHLSKEPVKYEVEAWCVGGSEGIKAYFIIDDMLYTADGDDGHWWLMSVCNVGWLKEIKEAINAVE